jgi:hypothetical protein
MIWSVFMAATPLHVSGSEGLHLLQERGLDPLK